MSSTTRHPNRSQTRDPISSPTRSSTSSPTRYSTSSPTRSFMRSPCTDTIMSTSRFSTSCPTRSLTRSQWSLTRSPTQSPRPRDPGTDIAELEVLTGGRYDYRVLAFVGEGRYGRVARCQRVDTREPVAIKVLRCTENLLVVARREAAMLGRLHALDADACNVVAWRDHFVHRGHVCFAFEMLDVSLGALLMSRPGNRLSLAAIRPVVQQVATALHALRSVGIIHADVKPDNVVMVDMRRQPFRLKLVDFGVAVAMEGVVHGASMQPLAYRAPEVLLGLPITAAVDVWSLGCMAANMFLGFRLHSGHCEYDIVRSIVGTQGMPECRMLDAGQHVGRFFSRRRRRRRWRWVLKTPWEYEDSTGMVTRKTRRGLDSLDQMLDILEAASGAELEDGRRFVDLVKLMLALDGCHRISPREVLRHPFVSLEHLAGEHACSDYAADARSAMAVCARLSRRPLQRRGGGVEEVEGAASSSNNHRSQERTVSNRN